MKRLLTIGQAAERLGLAVDTVRRLEAKGELRAHRTPGGHRRFASEVLEKYLATRRRSASRPSPRPRRPAPTRPARPSSLRRATPLYQPPPVYLEDEFGDDPADWEDEVEPPKVERPQAPAAALAPTIKAGPQEAPTMHTGKKTDEQERRKRIKAQGVLSIPYDVPAKWRAKVIADLERYVTAEEFPDWVSDWEAHRLVRGRVEDVLKPYHDRVAEDAAREKQDQDDQRRVSSLIHHGVSYARQETYAGWDYTPMVEARKTVEEELKAKVKANWTERRVEKLVDKILAEWEDEDEQVDDDDDEWDDEDDEY